MFITAGIVSRVKLSPLKHSDPFNLSVVLDTYKENPKKDFALSFEAPVLKHVKIDDNKGYPE